MGLYFEELISPVLVMHSKYKCVTLLALTLECISMCKWNLLFITVFCERQKCVYVTKFCQDLKMVCKNDLIYISKIYL